MVSRVQIVMGFAGAVEVAEKVKKRKKVQVIRKRRRRRRRRKKKKKIRSKEIFGKRCSNTFVLYIRSIKKY